MSDDGLTQADWIALCRAAMADRGLTTREVDDRAGLAEGYMGKILCGLVRTPTWRTVERVNNALGISLYARCAGAVEDDALTP